MLQSNENNKQFGMKISNEHLDLVAQTEVKMFL